MITIELVEEEDRPFWMSLDDSDFDDLVEEMAVEWSVRQMERDAKRKE